VILPGMSLALIVLHFKVLMAGIVLDVIVQVMLTQFVVMVHVMVMNTIKHAHQIAMHLVNVMLVKYLTVTVAMNAGPKAGLVMASQIVKISSMVLT